MSWQAEERRIAERADPATTEVFEEITHVPALLEFRKLTDVAASVDAAGEPRYLFEPVWAEGDYGIVSASDKAGKSWLAADAAVSVATGTPWLGIFHVVVPGSVVFFAGEGGDRKLVRRFRAISAARGVAFDLLDVIRVCTRVPYLTNDVHMAIVEEEVALTEPSLIVIDPLYLAARGARSADLIDMGAHLEAAQVIAQHHAAALMVNHHWNQTGQGRGAIRASGAGASAWGRVLVSADVRSRHTDVDTKRTSVVLDLDVQGDEVADQTVRIRRDVWADDPATLASPLHYVVSQLEAEPPPDPRTEDLSPSAGRVMRVLDAGEQLSVRSIGDRLAADATGAGPLRKRTINEALHGLADADLVHSNEPGAGRARLWWARDVGGDTGLTEATL